MTYLYIDESGDLGLGKKSSIFFVLTCVRIDTEETNLHSNRTPKKIRNTLFSKKDKKITELKFSNSRTDIIEKFLKKSSLLDVKIYSIISKKKDIDKNVFYTYLIKELLGLIFENEKNPEKICIYFDKCLPFNEIERLEIYLKTEFLSRFNFVPKMLVIHDNSTYNNGLQMVDFICGAIGRKYNQNNENYYKLIKNKIIIEKITNHAYLSHPQS